MGSTLIGNPLVAWIDDTTVQVGWGGHAIRLEEVTQTVVQWLSGMRGGRDREELLDAAVAAGLPRARAERILEDLRTAGLLGGSPGVRVALHPCGLLAGPLREALSGAGVQVVAGADVLVFPQGQVPSLLAAPRGPRRLVPVWFAARAVHVGPVIDEARGPCARCVDRTWADSDAGWWSLVSQASSVPTWHEPAQLTLAAGAIAHIAASPDTVGLEMIFDPDRPGPCWRVWRTHPRCECQQPQTHPA